MRSCGVHGLDQGYTSEVDQVDEPAWCQALQEFKDANIYQTWSHGAVISGRRKISHLVLRRNGSVAAIAQARIAKVPFLKIGIAYIRWGPLWRRHKGEAEPETFRQAVRALRNEYVHKRGLVLRIFPGYFEGDSSQLSAILEEEGFASLGEASRGRTILMDLGPGIEALREGMGSHWKRELKIAEKKGLEIIEGTEDEHFASFIAIYKEMVARKKFVEPNDINQFRLIQSMLPSNLKMQVMLCRSEKGVCAGLICSAIGDTAVYLFGATSDAGLRSNGSYLLHWKLLDMLKQKGISVYNLNGINPQVNPGTFKFKVDLAGRNGKDVYYLGRFDSCSSSLKYKCLSWADALRTGYRRSRERELTAAGIRLWPKKAT